MEGAEAHRGGTEAELRRLNRAYRALCHGMADIARASTQEELFRSVCTTLVDVGGYRLAWVGLPGSGEGVVGPVVPVASAGTEADRAYLSEISVGANDDALGRGPMGTALREGEVSVNRDTATNPLYAPWRDQALRHGFRSSIAVPIRFGKQTLAALSIYASEKDAFDVDETSLLARLADAAAVGLSAIRDGRTLAALEARLRDTNAVRTQFAMLDDAPHGFMALDPDGRYLYVNAMGAGLVKRTPAELLGRVFWEVFPGARESPVVQGFLRVLATGQPERSLDHYTRLDAWFESHAYPIPTGLAVHYFDVTNRKRLEEQLRQVHKMEAIGRLASGIAHDFNNLLSVILSYAGLLQKQLAPPHPLRADVLEIRDAAERAKNLTKQLLAFSRQQPVEPRILELDDVVRGMDALLRSLVGPEVVLSVVTGRGAGSVRADPSQLEQVVMNLAVNARDAMPGGGALSIESSGVTLDGRSDGPDLAPGPYALLTVTDTGTGMDEATRERIFEPFFTTKGAGGGTGLGLATVFGIVKQAKGQIEVLSEPGRGTTFIVYLPRADHPPSVDASRSSLQAGSRSSG